MTSPAILSRAGLDELIAALIADGYRVIGPVADDSAIELAEISSGAQLPAGWGADSGPGYDLSLTERIDSDGHRFLVDVGSEEAARLAQDRDAQEDRDDQR